MPDNFAGMTKGLHLFKRSEWRLWRDLASAKLPYAVGYGDYATVAINPAPEGIAWGYPINVRYTLDDEFLICRGVGTTGPSGVDLDVQLLSHAKSIVKYPTRHPLAHCWADTTIDKIATGAAPTQGLEHWVQLAVNRHIELVVSSLP